MAILCFSIIISAVIVVGTIVLYRIYSYEKQIKKDAAKGKR